MSLVLVGTPIGNLGDLSPRAVEELAGADVIACEDTRRTRALLTASGLGAGRRLVSLHEHNEGARVQTLLGRLAAGARVVLTSDAGMPLVSDPGAKLVEAVLAAGYEVEVVPGPSAVLAALVVSGMDTSRFCFEGFLPRSGRARTERFSKLSMEERTAVIFESPQRLGATLSEMAERFDAVRRVAVARELTKLHEETYRGTLAEAAANFGEVTVRGEVVIVLEGAVVTAYEHTDADIERAVQSWLDSGIDRKTAVSKVAFDLNVAKRRVYAIATTLERP